MTRKTERGELLGEEPVARFEGSVASALKRRPADEAKLAGALSALSPHSGRLTRLVGRTVETLVRRASFGRSLYAGTVRALSEFDGHAAAPDIERALATDEAGGFATLSAACRISSSDLSPSLARVASSRHAHLAFAAEVARMARGESEGDHLASLAPKIKESHRIALCLELCVPLLRHPPLPIAIAPALAVLRDAERHLGRWLVFAEVATRAGDTAPVAEARDRASEGASAARAAWGFIAWALSPQQGSPSVRPTLEVVSRLSDRPSADRDPAFLYRLAEASVPSAKSLLEAVTRGPLTTDTAVRAAMYLARDYGRDDLRDTLRNLAFGTRQDELRGLAAAALHDLGERQHALSASSDLIRSRALSTVAWGALLRAAEAGGLERILSEANFRRIQLGWLE